MEVGGQEHPAGVQELQEFKGQARAPPAAPGQVGLQVQGPAGGQGLAALVEGPTEPGGMAAEAESRS